LHVVHFLLLLAIFVASLVTPSSSFILGLVDAKKAIFSEQKRKEDI